MSSRLKAVLALALVILSGSATAQLSVLLEDTAKDMVGSRLAYAIRERLRQSSGFKLVTTSEEALFRFSMVTIDPQEGKGLAGYSTVYSVVFSAWQPQTGTWTYLNNYVGTCGSSRVAECADGLVADADKTADQPRAFYRTYFKKK